ncbi:MAG TPA: sensor histidine kinase, partial [Pseudonocardiaceae bacterium]|nr:sensor histidine kinase [Pseudonocardiaceae bacterium]
TARPPAAPAHRAANQPRETSGPDRWAPPESDYQPIRPAAEEPGRRVGGRAWEADELDRHVANWPWLAWLRGVVSRHPQVTDCLLAIGLLLLVGVRTGEPNHFIFARVFAVLLCAPLVWRRRFPVAVFSFQCLVAFVQWFLGAAQVADVALLIGLYTVAAHCVLRLALVAAGVLELGVAMAIGRWSSDLRVLPSLVFLTGMVTAAFVLGVNLRTQRAYLASLEDRARRAEHERDQQSQIATAGERARIAREMHDIVAHNLSVMIALADGAAFAARSGSPQAESAARQVSETGRQALAEMHRLLGVLRADAGSGASRAPQPGIEQLDDLVAQVRAAGLPTSITVSGQPFPLPPTAQLAVYRVVQEALTNVLKHADTPTGVRVVLSYAQPAVRVEITDDGRPTPMPANESSIGHGLAGMRERAAMFGGEVSAGPVTGGWRVRVRLTAGLDQTPAVAQ